MTSEGTERSGYPTAPEGSFFERMRKMRSPEAEDRRRRRRIADNVRSDSPHWNGLLTDANGVERKVRREIRTDGMKVTVVKEVTCHDHTLDRETYVGNPNAHGGRDTVPFDLSDYTAIISGLDPGRMADLGLFDGDNGRKIREYLA